MSRTRSPYPSKQAVARIVEGARSGGAELQRLEIGRDGKIILIVATSPKTQDDTTHEANEWDD